MARLPASQDVRFLRDTSLDKPCLGCTLCVCVCRERENLSHLLLFEIFHKVILTFFLSRSGWFMLWLSVNHMTSPFTCQSIPACAGPCWRSDGNWADVDLTGYLSALRENLLCNALLSSPSTAQCIRSTISRFHQTDEDLPPHFRDREV